MSGILQGLIGSLKSAASSAADAYFNLTTLLLNTSSTNGAQNNTFLDSSTNNFTITRNGNTTQGTFTPFSQTGWSNNFVSGSSQGLSVADNANLRLGSGDFTVECWFYMAGNSSLDGGGQARASLIAKVQNDPTNWAINIDAASTTTGTGLIFNFLGTQITYTGTIAQNTWHHVAVVRSGTSTGNIKIYLNGTSVASGTSTTTDSNTGAVTLGWWDYPASGYKFYFNGYISNARIVKGTAVYTSNFTPSTIPLTAITNTQLLTCQSNRFADSSTNAFAITTVGTPSVQAFSPFAPTAAYDTAVVGGSGYFDGSGDYLVTPSSASVSSTLLASDFTIECWLYLTTYPGGGAPIWTNSTSNSDGFSSVYVTSSGTVALGKVGVNEVVSTATVVRNAWNHFATVRSGATVYLYLNGAQIASGAASTYLNTSSAKPLQIGQSNQSTPSNLTGYISGYRAVSSALYTGSTYTIPTSVPTAISGTQLLLNFTNSGIYDSAAKNVLETVGNAQVSTTQAKWGTTAIYLDGTGDYAKFQTTSAANYNFTFGSGDFTIEMWVYPSNTSTVCVLVGQSDNATIGGGSFLIRINGNVDFYSGGTAYTCTGASPSANQWSHIAYVRNGTSLKTYLNGTQAGTATLPSSTTAMNVGSTNYPPILGAYSDGSGAFTGYIDDVRISKFARYTANFTAPTAAFPLQ